MEVTPTPLDNPPLEITNPQETAIGDRLKAAQSATNRLNRAYNRLHRAESRLEERTGKSQYGDETKKDPSQAPFREEHDRALAEYQTTTLDLVANLTEPVPGLEGVEVRKVPGRLYTPMCDEPTGFSVPKSIEGYFPEGRHHADMGFNTTFIPWLPAMVDLDYFYQHPEAIVHIDLTSLDQYVSDIVGPMLPRNGIFSFDTWLNWCLSKKILGAEMYAANARSEKVTKLLGRVRGSDGKVKEYRDHNKDEELFTYIPTPDDIEQRRVQVRERVSRYCEDNISEAFSIVALARWDIEEGLNLYEDSLSGLSERYVDFLAALEFNYPRGGRASYGNYAIAQAYPTLVMGGRQEQYYHGSFLNPHELDLDYFDALMLLSAEMDLDLRNYDSFASEGERWIRDRRGHMTNQRCLFGDHYNVGRSVDGLVLTMATMYFRMDDRQKKEYEQVIRHVFNKAARHHLFDKQGHFAKKLQVPGTNAEKEPERDEDIRPALSTAQIWQRKYAGALIDVSDLRPEHHIHGLHYDYQAGKHIPDSVEGFKADRFEVDDSGWLVLKEDAKDIRPEDIPLALSVEERRGQAVARKVESILHRPEDGNLDRLSSMTTMMGMVTGYKMPDDDLYNILMWLGGVQQQAGVIRDAPRSDVEMILGACHQIPDFASSDRLSQLMAIYTAFGYLPKEMVVERILSSAEAAGSLFTVRFALMLENMRRQDLANRGLDVSGYESPIFTARDEILQAKTKFDKKEITEDWYRLIVEHGLAAILEQLNTYCQFDWTMGSALGAMLVSDKTGSLYAQCGAQAEVMADFANFVSPEPCAYTSFREIDTDVPLAQWFVKTLPGDPVSHDHLMAQADFGRGGNLHVFVMDQNSAHILLTNKVETDKRRSDITTNTRVDKYPRLRRLELSDTPSWTAINYGAREKGRTSPVLAHLTKDFPHLTRYAYMFSPDEVLMLRDISGSVHYPLTERLDAFHKLLRLAPRVFGRKIDAENAASFANSIYNCIDLCRETEDYIPAIFLTNILSIHGAILETVGKSGLNLRTGVLTKLAMADKPTLEKGIEYYKDVLTETDVGDIWKAYDEYQAQLELAREKGEEEQFVNEKTAEASQVVTGGMVEVKEDIGRITDEDKLEGTLGRKTQEAMLMTALVKEQIMVATNQEGIIDDLEPDVHLIEIADTTSTRALEGILSGLSGNVLDERLLVLELILLKSEKAFLGSKSGLVQKAWGRLESEVSALGYRLPYSRDDLRRNLKEIMKRHNLLGRDPTVGLLN